MLSIPSHHIIYLANNHFPYKKQFHRLKTALKIIFKITDVNLSLTRTPNHPHFMSHGFCEENLYSHFSPYLESASSDWAILFLLKLFTLCHCFLESRWMSVIPLLADSSLRIWRQLLYPSLKPSPWKNILRSLDYFSLAWL